MLKKGDQAPEFELTDDSGITTTLSELLEDGPIILYFYPKDNTPGCTVQACDFRDSLPGLEGAGVAVLVVAAAVWFFVIREKNSGTGNKQVTEQLQPKPTDNVPNPVDPGPDKPAKKPGTVLWEFKTGDRVESSPAINSDGTVYVGSNDHKLYALNGKSGVKLWEFETGGFVYSSPAMGSDEIG